MKLVPLNEKDYVEAYFVTFERILAAHTISEDRWPHYFPIGLRAAVSPSDSGNYQKI